MVNEDLLAHALLEVGEGLISMAELLILARLWLWPQVSRSFRDHIVGPNMLADHEATLLSMLA